MYEDSTRCPQEARIVAVEPGSIAEEIGVVPGDVLLAVNGETVPDYIAYRFAITGEEITVDIAHGDEVLRVEIEKETDEDLGLAFDADVFDGMRRCANNCVFCFEKQMPAHMRDSLRLRDDDFRLSFLHGNFVTLTNLRKGEMARIIGEHLSPLFVSVHATDPEVRRTLLGRTRLPDIRAQLRQLAEGGIQLHAQIVLCPGWNDGAVLERTLDDLAELHPALLSVGIVPVGLTAHRPAGPEVRSVTPADAAAVLDVVQRRQQALLPRLGTRLVFAADEFYLAINRPLPSADEYEEFPQKENGIGLARLFLDELDVVKMPAELSSEKVTLVTGILAAPLLEELAGRLRQAGATVDVVPVPNTFYGGGVSVAGLLTGGDILHAVDGRDIGRAIILPAVVLNTDGVFLDDLHPADLQAKLGVPLLFCHGLGEVVKVIKKFDAENAEGQRRRES
ncbi:MAG TPA: DUF512 domain-containing protein [Armatimonadota bacterium]|jgi:putative radical SAM enzyme (TIGR03279 family)